jgi:hypothetical protein
LDEDGRTKRGSRAGASSVWDKTGNKKPATFIQQAFNSVAIFRARMRIGLPRLRNLPVESGISKLATFKGMFLAF